MSDLNISIVKLEPMRVASFHAMGTEPEHAAFAKMREWVKARGLQKTDYRIFGFNNPDPSPGSPNYGYEFWFTIGQDVEPEGDMEIKQISSGQYGVLRCEVKGDFAKIGRCWKQLVNWREESPYQQGAHQCLEEHIGGVDVTDDELVLDLYIPLNG
jgi:DNA gyrase inhibitor GyrI